MERNLHPLSHVWHYYLLVSSVIVFPHHFVEFAITAFIIILVPGPSVLFTIARAISWGRATAVATVIGNTSGSLAVSIIVAFGLGPILQRSHIIFTGVQVAGGLYLMYLGYDAIRKSPIHASDMTNQGDSRPSIRRSIRDGFWVGFLNPKVLIFFAAILPGFLDKSQGHLISQLLIMGVSFSIIAFLSDSTWGIIAGTIRNWLATEIKRLVTMRIIGGVVMVLLGIFTLVTAYRQR